MNEFENLFRKAEIINVMGVGKVREWKIQNSSLIGTIYTRFVLLQFMFNSMGWRTYTTKLVSTCFNWTMKSFSSHRSYIILILNRNRNLNLAEVLVAVSTILTGPNWQISQTTKHRNLVSSHRVLVPIVNCIWSTYGNFITGLTEICIYSIIWIE